jgi:hypothetical protein
MLSAPATIPATTDIAFASAAVPAPFFAPVSFTFSDTSRGRSHRSASRIVGTSPACAIRFGSSNAANTAAGLWEDFTDEVPCWLGLMEA